MPASHSLVCPGDAVFGYGFECRWFSTPGPLAGPLDGPISLLSDSYGIGGTSLRGVVGMIVKRCQFPFASPWESTLDAFRKNSVA